MEQEITTNVAVGLSVLVALLILRPLTAMLPKLTASLLRTRICLELEFNLREQITRNRLCMGMVLPMGLIIWRFRLYDPDWFSHLGPALRLLSCIAVIFLYWLCRYVPQRLLRHRRLSGEVYQAGCNFAFTANILATIVVALTACVLSLCGAADGVVRTVLLWLYAALYLVFVLRKFQIFASSCPIFSAILYLCALEVLPTGLLVVSALLT